MQKRGFHPTFLLFEGTCAAEKNLAYSAARKVSPLMLINCLVNRRDKGTKSQRDEEAKRGRGKERRRQREEETKR